MLIKSFHKIDFQNQSVIYLAMLLDPEILGQFNVFKLTGFTTIPTLFDNVIFQNIRKKRLDKIFIVQEFFPLFIKIVNLGQYGFFRILGHHLLILNIWKGKAGCNSIKFHSLCQWYEFPVIKSLT